MGRSIAELCTAWSSIPVCCYSKRRGWLVLPPSAKAPPGYTAETWPGVAAPIAVPIMIGRLLQQPDGLQAVCLDSSMACGC